MHENSIGLKDAAVTKFQRFTIFLPILYSLVFAIFLLIVVSLTSGALTGEAADLLQEKLPSFVAATMLLLLPSSLLSILLYGYVQAKPDNERNPFILCLCSLIVATLLSGYMWLFFYIGWETGAQVPVVVYGFPVTFFFGICIGFVIGLLWIVWKK